MKSRREIYYSPQFNDRYPTVANLVSIDDDFTVHNYSGNVVGDHHTPNYNEFTRALELRCYGSMRTYSTGDGELLFGVHGNLGVSGLVPYWATESVSPNTHNQALGDLYDRLRSDVDMSVDILQAGQTVSMVRGAAKALNTVRTFNPKRLLKSREAFVKLVQTSKQEPRSLGRKIIRAQNHAGNLWLQYVYGLKPTAQTIYGALHNVMRQASNGYRVARGRAKDVRKEQVFRPFSYGSEFYGQLLTTQERKERVEIKCLFKIPDDKLLALANYTSLNPASILWEMMPYSFIVDWFVDVGGYLRNLETALVYRRTFVQGYVTQGFSYRHPVSGGDSYSNDGRTYVLSVEGGLTRINWKQRYRLMDIPLPKVPVPKVSLGSGRLLNAAALLSQHLKR